MDKKIYMPNNDQMVRMIEDAWKAFKEQCAKIGLDMKDKRLEEFAQDIFVGGFCYGHNNCLSIVRGQFEVVDYIGEIFNGKSS